MTREQAIALAETKWWVNQLPQVIVSFQLFEPLLCMPFGDFHKAVEQCLGRSVYTHEFGLGIEGLRKEFLGEKPALTFQEIMGLIPEAKRVIMVAGELSQ